MIVTAGAESVHFRLPDMLVHDSPYFERCNGEFQVCSLESHSRCCFASPTLFVAYFHTHDLWDCPIGRSLAGLSQVIVVITVPWRWFCPQKKDSISAVLSLDIWHVTPFCWKKPHCNYSSSRRDFLGESRKWHHHTFVFSMKLGTCVINFMLLHVLVGKLYRHFWVQKLVGHPVHYHSIVCFVYWLHIYMEPFISVRHWTLLFNV
jgi:hypothetical protein